VKRYELYYGDKQKSKIIIKRFFVSPKSGRIGCCTIEAHTKTVRRLGMWLLRVIAQNLRYAEKDMIEREAA